MNQQFLKLLATMVASVVFFASSQSYAQNAGISVNGSIPNSSAIFDIDVAALKGQKKGLLIPRVTEQQRIDMNPLPAAFAEGLLVYQTDGQQPGFYFNRSNGFVPLWKLIGDNRWSSLEKPTSSLIVQHNAFTTNFIYDGVTSAQAMIMSANGLTTGNLLDLSSTSANGSSANSTRILNIQKLGANVNQGHTSYGIVARVANTGTQSTNVAGRFSSVGGTRNYALLVPADGGKVLFGGEGSAENAILSIKDGHFQSQQTTKPAIAANANAGVLASATVESFSSDMAGSISISTNVNAVAGEQAVITFNKPFNRPPIVLLTPTGPLAATKAFYVTSSTLSFKVFFTSAGAAGANYTYNYIVIEN